MPRHGERGHVTTQQEDGHSQDRRGASGETKPGAHWSWTYSLQNNNNNDTSIFVVKGIQSVLFYGSTKQNPN